MNGISGGVGSLDLLGVDMRPGAFILCAHVHRGWGGKV